MKTIKLPSISKENNRAKRSVNFKKKMIKIIENFFDDLSLIEPHLRKIKLYNVNDFNKKFKTKQTWPGLRSNFIVKENIFLIRNDWATPGSIIRFQDGT